MGLRAKGGSNEQKLVHDDWWLGGRGHQLKTRLCVVSTFSHTYYLYKVSLRSSLLKHPNCNWLMCSCPDDFRNRICSVNPVLHALYGLGYPGSSSKYVCIFRWSNYKLKKGKGRGAGQISYYRFTPSSLCCSLSRRGQGSNGDYDGLNH